MPRVPKDLISQLPRDMQEVVKKFNQYQAKLTCTKCTQIGTFEYTTNTSKKPAQPVFTCTACNNIPNLPALERELRQAQFSSVDTPTPIAVPINVPNKVTPTTATITARTTTTTNKQTKIPKPAQKRNRVTSDDEGSMATTLTTNNNNGIVADTVTPTPTVGITPDPVQAAMLNQMNTMNATILALNATIESLRAEIDLLRKENIEQKQQISHGNNKMASLEQKTLKIQKQVTMENLNHQQRHEGGDEEENKSMGSGSSSEDDEEFPSLPSTQNQSQSGAASQWTHPMDFKKIAEKRAAIEKQKAKKLEKRNLQTNTSKKATSPSKKEEANKKLINSAIRAFSAPNSDNNKNGFSYVYYPSKSRLSRNQQRRHLMALGITNGRILDIHYPDKHVVALLVHNDYKTELIEVLQSGEGKLSPLSDYSHLDPSTIKDEQFANLGDVERSQLAATKHNERLIRALPHIRDHMTRAVAHFFHSQSWINNEQLKSHLDAVNQKFADRKRPQHTTPPPNSSSTQSAVLPAPAGSPTISSVNVTNLAAEDSQQQTQMDNSL